MLKLLILCSLVGLFSSNLLADPYFDFLVPVTVVMVDKGNSDYAIRRCIAFYPELISQVCNQPMLIPFSEFDRLRETLRGNCAEVSQSLDQSECEAGIDRDLNELAQATTFSIRKFVSDSASYTGTALEKLPGLPRVR